MKKRRPAKYLYPMFHVNVAPDVVLSEELSKHENRYVIIDTKSGSVLCNAQGYGFRSEERAWAYWRNFAQFRYIMTGGSK